MNSKLNNNFVFVKPLYRTVSENNNKAKDNILCIERTLNLDGIDCQKSLIKTFEVNKNVNKTVFHLPKRFKCKQIYKDSVSNSKVRNINYNIKDMENPNVKPAATVSQSERNGINIKIEEETHINNKEINVTFQKWLRIYPAVITNSESVLSIIIRCLFCQLGLITFLVIWTFLGVFIINLFEEPNETKLSLEFGKEQNQLVVDLATELRQITPLSPKWRNTIESRLEEERRLTIAAVGRGIRLEPGTFWSLPGTFLFTVYIMTALGFGAPVPQTIGGRSWALLYALFAVPAHFCLVINASRCIVSHVETFRRKCRFRTHKSNKSPAEGKSGTSQQDADKKHDIADIIHYKILNSCCMMCAGRGIPLALVLYYTSGAIFFGYLRNKDVFDTILFPLDFTTSGGLEQVSGFVRCAYGLYLEGGMILVGCTIATIRRCSSNYTNSFVNKYKLYYVRNKI